MVLRPRAAPVLPCLAALIALASAVACKRTTHARVASFTRPPMPAGFVEQTGTGWRIAVPSTWATSAQAKGGAWVFDDPQAAEDYRANVSVVTEPYTGESYDYARATEESLHHDARATVETAREDVVDGDPTFIIESRWAPSPPAAVGFRTMQADLASRGTGYVVTCAAAAGAFERYRSTCEAIVRSFAVER
jgi:hypothetical protein